MSKRNCFFLKYKKNLLDLFQFLTSEQEFKRIIPNLAQLHQTTRILQSSNRQTSIRIELPPFELKLGEGIKCGSNTDTDSFLSIGGPIEFDQAGKVIQSVSVCLSVTPHTDIQKCTSFCTPEMQANINHIIRRFHFDIDSTQSKGDRPISHFQYGGNINDGQKGSSEYLLIKTLDLPRIPSMPLDIVQVINFFLHQFSTKASPLAKMPKWRNIVLENDKIWKEFYIQNLIDSIGDKSTLYDLLCSEKPNP
ncbi:MAG: hypothetical protein IBX55_17340 [Methyloprofundus sp.]|nr:hypothetical protein [Methyloprofundus sp.]